MAIKILLFFFLPQLLWAKPKITIGSKAFTESYVLAEILAQSLEATKQFEVVRKFGLGGTGIVFESLKNKNISIYPEYTGTIKQVLLKQANISDKTMQKLLAKQQLYVSESLGFNNTYAIGMLKDTAKKLQISKVSDLAKHPNLKYAFSYEYTKRKDGLAALERAYNFRIKNFKAMEHSLAYRALSKNKVDAMELYSTDAKIHSLDIKVLEDDKKFFPQYLAVFLTHQDIISKYPEVKQIFSDLSKGLNEDVIIELNSLVENKKYSFAQAANSFLQKDQQTIKKPNELIKLTWQHFQLVWISLLSAILVSVPLAILAYKFSFLSQGILAAVGILQTLPSLALLCFMIPFFGIGKQAALFALFIYALLPIVRSTYTGLKSIPSSLIESADSIGLNAIKKLLYIEVPLSSMSILSGIKTSAVINVGTATLAAFIGAGGYGKLIVTGLALNDTNMILKGAIPAAVMAIVFHFIFELIEKFVVPKSLKN